MSLTKLLNTVVGRHGDGEVVSSSRPVSQLFILC
jgi:hypothetical protein